jgi:hypothetical protein
MKIKGLPVIDVEEREQITVAVRADDLLEGDGVSLRIARVAFKQVVPSSRP